MTAPRQAVRHGSAGRKATSSQGALRVPMAERRPAPSPLKMPAAAPKQPASSSATSPLPTEVTREGRYSRCQECGGQLREPEAHGDPKPTRSRLLRRAGRLDLD